MRGGGKRSGGVTFHSPETRVAASQEFGASRGSELCDSFARRQSEFLDELAAFFFFFFFLLFVLVLVALRVFLFRTRINHQDYSVYELVFTIEEHASSRAMNLAYARATCSASGVAIIMAGRQLGRKTA